MGDIVRQCQSNVKFSYTEIVDLESSPLTMLKYMPTRTNTQPYRQANQSSTTEHEDRE